MSGIKCSNLHVPEIKKKRKENTIRKKETIHWVNSN
jgi:hypothetical protein